MLGRRRSAGLLVAEGQAGAGPLHHPGVVGLRAARPEPVVEVEVELPVGLPVRVGDGAVGGHQLPASPDVGVRPRHRAVAITRHLRHLMARLIQNVVRLVHRRAKPVRGRIAAPARNRSLSHASTVGVIDVPGHDVDAIHRWRLDRTNLPIAVVQVLVPVAIIVAQDVTRRVIAGNGWASTHLIVGIVGQRLRVGGQAWGASARP